MDTVLASACASAEDPDKSSSTNVPKVVAVAEGCERLRKAAAQNCIDLRVCQISSATAGGKQIVSGIDMRQSKVVSNLVSGNFGNRLTIA